MTQSSQWGLDQLRLEGSRDTARNPSLSPGGEVKMARMWVEESEHGEKLMTLKENLIEIQSIYYFNLIKSECNSK